MTPKWIEKMIGPLDQKKRYRQAKARMEHLPEPYRSVAHALQRYVINYGGITDGDTLVQMLVDLTDLWERAALDGTSVRGVVGDDPVEFADTFAQAYVGRRWIDKERAKLVRAIENAERVPRAGS